MYASYDARPLVPLGRPLTTQGLDPETYLTEVIKRLPHNATPAQAAELTPARLAAALRTQTQQVA